MSNELNRVKNELNNDLISREALKKAVDKEFEKANLSEYEACVCVCEIYDKCIDNAPTVIVDNYAMGYQDGVRKVLSEKTASEWIDTQYHGCYKCSVCGKDTEQEYGLTKPILYDFCPKCGADMRRQ